MSYFTRWQFAKHTPGGHDHDQKNHAGGAGGRLAEVEAKYAGRERWPNGRVKPQAGEKVFQEVMGFGGQPVRIFGVIEGKKAPRVRVTGNDALLGGGTRFKTYALSHHWMLDDDPVLVQLEERRKEAEAKAKQQQADQQNAAEQRLQGKIREGAQRLTDDNVKVGQRIYDARSERYGTVTDVWERKPGKPITAFARWDGEQREGSLGYLEKTPYALVT